MKTTSSIEICTKHGNYASLTTEAFGATVKSSCPTCEQEEQDKILKEDYDKQNLEKSNNHDNLEKAGIPKRFYSVSFDNYQAESEIQQNALKSSVDYAKKYQEINVEVSTLFFCGTYGTGKTHLAISVLRAVMEQCGKVGKYTTVIKMIRNIRSSYHPKSERTEQEIMDEYINSPLLVLDEVGVQLGTDSERLIMFEIINERYNNMRSTIIISNLSFNGMKSYLGESVIDRLKSQSGDLVVMDWKSYRSKK